MKDEYKKPVIEKIEFDYKDQIVTSGCFESVMNIRVGSDLCAEGTPTYMGWTKEQTGV